MAVTPTLAIEPIEDVSLEPGVPSRIDAGMVEVARRIADQADALHPQDGTQSGCAVC